MFDQGSIKVRQSDGVVVLVSSLRLLGVRGGVDLEFIGRRGLGLSVRVHMGGGGYVSEFPLNDEFIGALEQLIKLSRVGPPESGFLRGLLKESADVDS